MSYDDIPPLGPLFPEPIDEDYEKQKRKGVEAYLKKEYQKADKEGKKRLEQEIREGMPDFFKNEFTQWKQQQAYQEEHTPAAMLEKIYREVHFIAEYIRQKQAEEKQAPPLEETIAEYRRYKQAEKKQAMPLEETREQPSHEEEKSFTKDEVVRHIQNQLKERDQRIQAEKKQATPLKETREQLSHEEEKSFTKDEVVRHIQNQLKERDQRIQAEKKQAMPLEETREQLSHEEEKSFTKDEVVRHIQNLLNGKSR